MAADRQTVTITTDGSGNGSGAVEVLGSAKIDRIRYVKHGSTPFDNTVDISITLESTGESVWVEADVTASKTAAPRQATHTTAGVAATYDGTRAALDKITVVKDRILIAVAQGGASKIGTFHVILE